MKFSYKTDSRTVAFVKEWQDIGISAAGLLFVYGTLPEPDSVTPDSFSQALVMAQQEMQMAFEDIGGGSSAQDVSSAAAKLTACLQTVNLRLREASQFLGQGIYMGGTVLYGTPQEKFAFAFGDGVLYSWDGTVLRLLSAAPSADNLIRDALGSKEIWIGNCLQLSGSSDALIAATGYFQNLEAAQEALRASDHADAASLLYPLLTRSWTAPHGILHILPG